MCDNKGVGSRLQLNSTVLAAVLTLSPLVVVVIVIIVVVVVAVVVIVVVVTLLATLSSGSRVGLSAHGEGCGGEPVGEVDLGADGVCEVRDKEDVLDVVVAAKRLAQVSCRGQVTEREREAYKSFSMSARSTFGARASVFIKNWPRAEEGSASSSRTLLT